MFSTSNLHSSSCLSIERRAACVALLIVLLASLATGCGPSGEATPSKVISLPDDVLPGRTVLDVQRVDTDTDAHNEWVVFYRFDQVQESGPVAALIYDVVEDPTSNLPLVYPYRLRTPQESYLAQVKPDVELVDIVNEPSGITPRREVLFKTDNEAVFFRVEPNLVNKPGDNPALYRCVGFFRSRDGVYYNADTDEVVVTSREAYERSQLVTKYFYRPEADGYFITGTTSLVTPFGSAVDFPGEMPEDILDTPYPEKIALAFYKTFGKSGAKPTILEYLSKVAGAEFMAGKLKYGSPYPLNELQSAVVKELSYYATEDASQSAVVAVKVVFQRANGEKSSLIEVHWNLIRVEGQWKLDYPQP